MIAYVGEHLVFGKIGHLFVIMAFVASLLAAFCYYFAAKENESSSILDPRILLDYLNLDPVEINNVLKKEYVFDFELAATKIEQLSKSLAETKRGHMTPEQAIIIKRGPKVLEYAQSIHLVIHQFLIDAGIDVAGHYPAMSQIIIETTQQVLDELKKEINLATEQTAEHGLA